MKREEVMEEILPNIVEDLTTKKGDIARKDIQKALAYNAMAVMVKPGQTMTARELLESEAEKCEERQTRICVHIPAKKEEVLFLDRKTVKKQVTDICETYGNTSAGGVMIHMAVSGTRWVSEIARLVSTASVTAGNYQDTLLLVTVVHAAHDDDNTKKIMAACALAGADYVEIEYDSPVPNIPAKSLYDTRQVLNAVNATYGTDMMLLKHIPDAASIEDAEKALEDGADLIISGNVLDEAYFQDVQKNKTGEKIPSPGKEIYVSFPQTCFDLEACLNFIREHADKDFFLNESAPALMVDGWKVAAVYMEEWSVPAAVVAILPGGTVTKIKSAFNRDLDQDETSRLKALLVDWLRRVTGLTSQEEPEKPAEQTSGWIPTAEKLPPDLRECQVTYVIPNGKPRCDDHAFVDSGKWYWTNSVPVREDIRITAWRPPIQPYQEA